MITLVAGSAFGVVTGLIMGNLGAKFWQVLLVLLLGAAYAAAMKWA